MQQFYSDFEAAFSKERMSGYRLNPQDREDLILARYIYNVEISSALYNSLHILEVALRNGIHREASRHFRDMYWFLDYTVLKAKDVATMASCMARLEARSTARPVPPGKIIADATFGFWTNLFITDYEVKFWRPIIHRVFPHAPRPSLTRQAMHARLDPMRYKLRNRISHYEPIWHFADLQTRHDEIIDTISWLNKPAHETAVLIDSFPAIYAKGVNGYRRDVQLFKHYIP